MRESQQIHSNRYAQLIIIGSLLIILILFTLIYTPVLISWIKSEEMDNHYKIRQLNVKLNSVMEMAPEFYITILKRHALILGWHSFYEVNSSNNGHIVVFHRSEDFS